MSDTIDCYDLPQYWDLSFQDETIPEADFIEAAARKYCKSSLQRLYEPGCGGGRQIVEMASRGYHVTGVDASSAAVTWGQKILAAGNLPGTIEVADMTDYRCRPPVDVAYCFVNTFRHLLSEQAAQKHLQRVAASLKQGGLYLIGMHLLPPDAAEEDEEQWSETRGDVVVEMRLDVTQFCRKSRLETLRFHMHVQDEDRTLRFTSEYQMRIYRADQFLKLLSTVPELRLLDVYDFCFDIDEPLELTDELGDTVFVLQRR